MEPETLFLQGPDEALDDPIALWLANERRRVRDAQPGELVAKRVGRILRPPVAPQRQAAGDILAEGSVGVPHALVHGLEGGPAVADLRDVPAHDVGAGVVDRTESPAPPFLCGMEPGGIGAPQDVGRRRRDGAGVRRVPVPMPGPLGRQ